jgi:hypothetical protein
MLASMSSNGTGQLALVVVFLSSCAVPYAPDSLLTLPPLCTRDSGSAPHATTRTLRVGGLDVHVNAVTNHLVPESSVLFAYVFGNRRDAPARIDFTGVRVTARTEDGTRTTWTPFDPRREIRPGTLGPRAWGAEAIEYDPPRSGPPPSSICIDFARLTDDVSANSEVCFQRVASASARSVLR